MPPKKFTDAKKFNLWDDCKTVFIWGGTSKNKGSPYEVFVRISEDYRWKKKGTKWMHYAKYSSDRGYLCEGYVSTSWMKLHINTMLGDGCQIVCSEKPVEFKGVFVK